MNKLVKKAPILGSSIDPEKLSLTVKGVLGLVATILVGFGVSQMELNSLIDMIVNLVVLTGQLVTLAIAIYGGIRKVITHFQK